MVEELQIVLEHANRCTNWVGSGITGIALLITIGGGGTQFSVVVGAFVLDVIGDQHTDLGVTIGLIYCQVISFFALSACTVYLSNAVGNGDGITGSAD